MSTTNSAEPEPPASQTLIESAFDIDGIAAIDRRISALRERMRAANPCFARATDGYRDEIDVLLDLRLWLTGAALGQAASPAAWS